MSAAHRILLAGAMPPPVVQALSALAPVEPLSPASGPLPSPLGADFTVLVTNATLGASAALIERLPGLRAICSLGVGCDAIDLEAAGRRGIVVSNTPDVLTDCVADLAIGVLIDVARGLSAADRHVRRGDWPRRGSTPPGTRVSGKRLGLLGMGRIGQAIAHRAAAFDMPIRYHARTPRPALPWSHEASLQELAAWCDFLVVACTGGPETRHLVSAEVLRALGPRGYLVNIARGSVVDEAALLQCLQAGEVAGAGLDVFENEPQVPPAFFAMEQVLLLPHVGSATRETRQAMAQLLVENVESFVRMGTLVTPAGR